MSVIILYSMFSKQSVLSILKGSTGMDRHLSKSNGFVTSSGPLRSASMELSPIKMVSVKMRSSSKNVGDASFFLPF
jgi:hypothetical protein